MQVFQGNKGGLIKAWIDGVSVEDQARAQLDNIASMPFIHKHVAIMPDVHWWFSYSDQECNHPGCGWR